MRQVRDFGCQLVEVTGGEPLAQREALTLINNLCDEGYEVLIETGGYVSTELVDTRAKIILDVKCPASGEADRNHWPNLERLRPDRDVRRMVTDGAPDFAYRRAPCVRRRHWRDGARSLACWRHRSRSRWEK